MSDFIEVEDAGLVYWPMCPIKHCKNRICLSLGSDYCWPHTGTGQTEDEFLKAFDQCTQEA